MREINEETKNIMPRAKMMCEGCFAIRKGRCIALNEVPEEKEGRQVKGYAALYTAV